MPIELGESAYGLLFDGKFSTQGPGILNSLLTRELSQALVKPLAQAISEQLRRLLIGWLILAKWNCHQLQRVIHANEAGTHQWLRLLKCDPAIRLKEIVDPRDCLYLWGE